LKVLRKKKYVPNIAQKKWRILLNEKCLRRPMRGRWIPAASRGGRMELPLRSNDPLPMVAGIHERNKRKVVGKDCPTKAEGNGMQRHVARPRSRGGIPPVAARDRATRPLPRP
jgi:hypothetical protein